MLVNWQLQALIEQGLVNEWKNDSDEWKKISWRNLHNAGQRISSWSAFMPNTGLEKVFKGPSSANSGHSSFSLIHLVKVTKQLCPALLLPGALLNITFENTLFNAKCFFFPSMHENKQIGPLRERLGVSASPRYTLLSETEERWDTAVFRAHRHSQTKGTSLDTDLARRVLTTLFFSPFYMHWLCCWQPTSALQMDNSVSVQLSYVLFTYSFFPCCQGVGTHIPRVRV